MPITGTSTDYTGRQIDVGILQYPSPSSGGGPVTVKFGSPSNFVAGIQKLVQRYLIMMCTQLGSQEFFPTFGTDFYDDITTTSALNNIGAQHVFNYANLIVGNAMLAYQATNPPAFPDEGFQSATLLEFVTANDVAYISIQITSLAGTSVQFLMPVPETQGNQ